MKPLYAPSCLALIGRHLQLIDDTYPLNHQHIAVLFDFATRASDETAFVCADPARFQRASKGPRQSTGGSCHYIIERGCVWSVHIRIDAVMRGNLRVHPE